MKPVFLFLSLLLLGSCVEPYSFTPGTLKDLLVVYGAVTDQPGPYVISLTQNGPIDEKPVSRPVGGAHLTITSDAGESEDLVEIADGQYASVALQGVVGRTYVLHITTREGTVYESIPDKMLPVGKFTNLHSKFIQRVSPFLNVSPDPDGVKHYNPLSETLNGFSLIIDAEFDPLQQGRAVWRWTGTFEYQTAPWAHGYYIGKEFILDPLPCSGVFYDKEDSAYVQRYKCTCCVCYHTEHSQRPITSDIRYIRNDKLQDFPVTFIPADPLKLGYKYFISIEQSSASPQVYDFWKRVEAGSQKSSDLFQTPAPPAIGNIKTITEGGKKAVGLFAAYAVYRDTISLNVDMIPYARIPRAIHTFQTGTNDCLELIKDNTTTDKPPFF